MSGTASGDQVNIGNDSPVGDLSNTLLLNKFRVRICRTVEVPVLMDNHFINNNEIVMIDMPATESNDKGVECDAEKQTLHSTDCDAVSGDGPLVFDFLSLSKLEQQCKENDGEFRRPGAIISPSHFECNPVSAATAFGLRNRLMRQKLPTVLDKSLLDAPICIIANAKDQLGTTFVGFHSSNSRITTFHTRCLGRFGDQCASVLRSLHQRFGSLESRSKAMALYSILGKDASLHGTDKFPANMSLTFRWDEKWENLLCPPSPSASAVFRFSPGWKDKRVYLLESTEELQYLLRMANVLDSGSVMVWPTGNETTCEDVLNEVKKLVTQYRLQNNDAERTLHGIRHVDFTELLWDILKKCVDFKNLVAALNLIFDALKQCRINAILHEDNRSTIARLIRDAQSCNLMLPRLEALTPIQILLEIGVERFRRDMVQAFITAGFMTSDTDLDLKTHLNSGPEERARALLPLHLALQTMLEIKRYLALPPHVLTNMTRSVIGKYCSAPITDISKVFYEMAVPQIHVQQDLLHKLPDLWTYETTYSCGNSVVAHTSVHFTRKPQLLFLEDRVFAKTEMEDIQESDKRNTFLCTYTTCSILNIEDF